MTFGKIIGGGMPVGAYCGSRALMEEVAPCGPVSTGGHPQRQPGGHGGGLAQLRFFKAHPELYPVLEAKASRLAEGLRDLAAETGTAVSVNQIGSLLAPFFTPSAVSTFVDAKGSDGEICRYFAGCWSAGSISLRLSLRRCFFPAARLEHLEQTFSAAREVLRVLDAS